MRGSTECAAGTACLGDIACDGPAQAVRGTGAHAPRSHGRNVSGPSAITPRVIQLKTKMSGSPGSSARRADWLRGEIQPQAQPHAGPAGSQSIGATAAVQWLAHRRLSSTGVLRWHVEIALDVVDGPAPTEFDERTATRFHIDIYSEEWGVFFCHAGRSSWVRITDIAFVHGRDDFGLLAAMPMLKDIGALLR